ncbi:SusD/RagB family nutrient-binding outer membrane lipoprotein [Sphingobacterium spiritivorum]|uniref:SusD/RagB family nutrient-binding outer membrane lipoprotein n=1 Tax=Sphingobacterium spiritivorum ATCC 33861 TaxID=525373 RepID=D7VPJ7_SPHSI|nr:SusD/RagB family nutrient-binding outer membrane lipoprotein [Sphingobacterium spiritivorum]EFK57844.1 hypothetical protein HMPREF0766_12917 [Sphingobacterium spiritivorum ATCC 33861]QQT36130.1 SusD/RagB family nutrient-binding outer membrane lipoprotein [Sphingobacterium spiritivorum]WQD32865.1 SusD/RagB family nutrient-binding outer membrane lipoprotein [Sphingobacterium spiritivorum]SUJ16023.1 Susd and RagB outer membrane lipoprotein [Sphingobacterium spiritivorum]
MKLLKFTYTGLLGLSLLTLASCSDEKFTEINTNPNLPSKVSTTSLLISAQKQTMDAIRSEEINYRGAQLFAQYFSQNIYTDPSRYQIPTSYSDNFWIKSYKALNNLNEIIKLNTDEATRIGVTANNAGTNTNQIAIARVLKSYLFHSLTDVFGDIPYESYGNKDPDFQALQQSPDNLTPKYATQEKIYKDILNELKQAADTLFKYSSANTFGTSDNIYKGSNQKWYKFANSLRLRLATRIALKDAALSRTHIESALAQGVFTSNDDNAAFKYSSASPNEAPLYRATVIANRKDFAVSNVIIDALKGIRGPFTTPDPRLAKYANPNASGVYNGQIYGLPLEAGQLFPESTISLPGTIINAANYAEVLQEYAEVQFLISEYKNWDQTAYTNGVKASLTKWGVNETDATAYLSALPAANKQNVLTQKYLALYNQGIESWSEIRRTGYPLFLIKSGDLLWTGLVGGVTKTYYFTPEVGQTIPNRLVYPIIEQNTNKANYQDALKSQGDDVITNKIWWNK